MDGYFMAGLEFAPPKYAQIVQTIQHRIEAGTYVAGQMLPSESQLVREFGAGRSTVVRALQILSLQGWIDREHGRGSFVKGIPEPGAKRPHAAGSAWDVAEVEPVAFAGRALAPPRIAPALGLPPESPALLRRRLILDEHEAPSELVELWFPLEVASGTDLADTDPIPVGVRAHLQTVKQLRAAQVAERLSARHPSPQEAELLGLQPQAPVLGVLARVLDASGAVLAVVDVVLPGDLHELEDTYPATQ